MCYLDETMDDNTILNKLKSFINMNDYDYNNIIYQSYEYTKNNLSYNNAVIHFNKIFNNITNNTENNQIFTHIYENKLWHKEYGSGEGSSIEFNKYDYIPFLKTLLNSLY